MLSKYIVPAICASLSAQGVAAGTVHRHLHQLAKKDYVTDVVVVTEVVYQTIYPGQEEQQQATPTPDEVTPVASVVATSSSTSSSSSSPVIVQAVQTTPAAAPTTTMVTKVSTSSSSSAAQAASSSKAAEVAQGAGVVNNAASSATPAATTLPSVGGGKRGIAYDWTSPNGIVAAAVAASGGKLTWAYNWLSSPAPVNAMPSGITYIPTLKSLDQSSTWAANAQKAIDAGSPALFNINEPDISSQSPMTPAAAAAAHRNLMNPFQGKALLSAPAISSSVNANQGTDWLSQWIAACPDCHFDFCNAHFYGPGGQAGANQFLAHLVKVNQVCGGKPVWVTEFRADDTPDNQKTFLTAVLKALDTDPTYNFVAKYAYFFFADGELTTNGALNDMGKLYTTA